MANVNSTAYIAYIAPEAAQTIVADKSGCAAGMFAPTGGVSHKQEGGYKVSGQYQFGSGSGHASYIGCGSIVMIDGEMPAPHPSGMPQSRCCFVPKDNVVMQGNWDVVGLSGTGSYDYAVPEQDVHEDFTFDLFDAHVRSGGAIFRMGPVPLAAICHVGWGLGVARRALDEIRDIVNDGRARMGAAPMKDQGTFQRPFAKHSMALDAAEEYNRRIYRDVVAQLESGADMSLELFQQTRAAATYLTQVAEEATTFAYQMAGSKAMRHPSVLQRCMRDMMVGGRHMFVDDKNYEDWAQVLLAS
jgi:alkylation response protein AidB-like acyl-CoA dehydrogenase